MSIVTLQEDENGDLILPLSPELLAHLNVKIGDDLKWVDNGNGSFSFRKAAPKVKTILVMVDTVSMFRHRYVVEVPADHPEYALDTVAMNEAEEFSQESLGETITSHRIVTQEEALKVLAEDAPEYNSWTDEYKIEKFFTKGVE